MVAQAQIQPIERKRADVLVRVAQQGLGTALAGTVPTPALELTKHLGIALADAWMFWDIYKIYYNEELSAQKLRELLNRAGIIVVTGGVISYGAVRISQSLISEVLHFVPIAGWLVAGLLSGSTSVAVGLAWMLFVEDSYRNKYQLEAKPMSLIPDKTTLSDVLPAMFDVNSKSKEDAFRDETTTRVQTLKEAEAFAGVVDAEEVTEEIPEGEIIEEMELEVEAEAVEAVKVEAEPVKPEVETAEVTQDEKILTEHPDADKDGVHIDREKYEIIREAILNTLRTEGENGEMALKEVNESLERQLPDFDGSISWYVTTVKLDLEAKNMIERVPKASPQRIRLIVG